MIQKIAKNDQKFQEFIVCHAALLETNQLKYWHFDLIDEQTGQLTPYGSGLFTKYLEGKDPDDASTRVFIGHYEYGDMQQSPAVI